MRSFYKYSLIREGQESLDNARWYVFENDFKNKIEVFVNISNSQLLEKGHYFKAVRVDGNKYLIIDKGNVDFFERNIIVRIEEGHVLDMYFDEEDAIRASELAFKGYPDPEGENFDDKFADRLDDIGLPHK